MDLGLRTDSQFFGLRLVSLLWHSKQLRLWLLLLSIALLPLTVLNLSHQRTSQHLMQRMALQEQQRQLNNFKQDVRTGFDSSCQLLELMASYLAKIPAVQWQRDDFIADALWTHPQFLRFYCINSAGQLAFDSENTGSSSQELHYELLSQAWKGQRSNCAIYQDPASHELCTVIAAPIRNSARVHAVLFAEIQMPFLTRALQSLQESHCWDLTCVVNSNGQLLSSLLDPAPSTAHARLQHPEHATTLSEASSSCCVTQRIEFADLGFVAVVSSSEHVQDLMHNLFFKQWMSMMILALLLVMMASHFLKRNNTQLLGQAVRHLAWCCQSHALQAQQTEGYAPQDFQEKKLWQRFCSMLRQFAQYCQQEGFANAQQALHQDLEQSTEFKLGDVLHLPTHSQNSQTAVKNQEFSRASYAG